MKRYQINLIKKEILRYFAVVAIFLVIFYVHLFNKPVKIAKYPYVFRVEDGETLSQISNKLKDDGLIRSRSFFNMIAVLGGNSNSLKSGAYVFEEPLRATTMVDRLAEGDFGLETIRITFPEGATREEIADIASRRLSGFDVQSFMLETKEGYLFPDTYNFFEIATAQDVHKQLSDNFEEKISPYRKHINKSGHTEEEIIIMASIIEKEANTPESRRIVSGILWNRIKDDIALQVDATFVYGIGKGTFDLTKDDLASDGPYNTYVRKGLPPTPISNPGIDSIEAAIFPAETQYYYFLTGADGEMYYSRTFEGHKANREKYLY